MSRTVYSSAVVQDQIDIYDPDTDLRVEGIVSSFLTSIIFKNNTPLDWSLLDGSSVANSSMSSGSIYFNEFVGLPGYYSVRFYPSGPGFWRLILKYGNTEFIKEYDVISPSYSSAQSSGLVASFS